MMHRYLPFPIIYDCTCIAVLCPKESRSDIQGRREEFSIPDKERRAVECDQAGLVKVSAE